MPTIIRAIDLGYGHTKFSIGPTDEANRVEVRSFPSFAPNANVIGEGFSTRHDVVEVSVRDSRDKDAKYVVGPEAQQIAGPNYIHPRDHKYVLSDQYLALCLGALYYMKLPSHVINLLVVGLPLTTFVSHKEDLRGRLVGKHRLPDWKFTDNRRMIDVEIQNVLIVPQPFGPVFEVAAQPEGAELTDEPYVAFDLGYYTFDWVKGLRIKPDPSRSGSQPGGMNKVIQLINDQIASDVLKLDPKFKNFNLMTTGRANLEEGLRTGIVKCGMGEFEIVRYMPKIKDLLRTYVKAAANSIGDSADIQSIVVAGGGASLIEDIVRDEFMFIPRVLMAKEPQLAICRGFQRMGEEKLANQVAVA
jgi:plasmid segregation protein ParM